MNQLKLTNTEIEKYTGISGLSTVKIIKNIAGITNALRVSASMFGIVKAVGTGGAAVIRPIGVIVAQTGGVALESGVLVAGGAKVTGGFALTATLGITIATSLTGAFLALASLGIPVAEAKKIVRENNLKSGFIIGVAIGILGYGKTMFYSFIDRTHGSGFAPSYMRGVAQQAFNIGLVLGFQSSCELSSEDKKKYMDTLTTILIDEAKSQGTKLYMNNWSNRDWVYYYASAFSKI